MKVSEVLNELTGRPQQAELLVAEKADGMAPTRVLSVESIVRPDSPNAVFMMARTITRPSFEPKSGTIQATIRKPVDDKFELLIGDVLLFSHINTEDEAKIFVRGYTMGRGVLPRSC